MEVGHEPVDGTPLREPEPGATRVEHRREVACSGAVDRGDGLGEPKVPEGLGHPCDRAGRDPARGIVGEGHIRVGARGVDPDEASGRVIARGSGRVPA